MFNAKAELTLRYKMKLSKKDREDLLKDYRDIPIGRSENFFPNNSISTTKYTIYNFIFLNLYEQFSKIANLYFLFLAILQMVKAVSITNGFPSILPPLMFIVFLTMLKDVFEDYKRYKSDQEENNKETSVYEKGRFVKRAWKDVHVGDILKVEKNEFFPADLALLGSNDYRKGQCFIETKNLDGETNLKGKFVCEDLKDKLRSDQDALSLTRAYINAEGPNQYLNVFKGSITVDNEKLPISAHNFLLRGCILRNTDYIIGCVVYSG